ncbi:hypothetical protein BCR33DRAFT_641968, partial [Rhizoclosmatium globosum]
LNFLPPYSPDFNPIEQCFSWIKGWLRKHIDWVHRQEDGVVAIDAACMSIDKKVAAGAFKHCGY